jgi:hypothetical protein
MFILLGTLFIAYEGTSALSGLYESYGATDLSFAAQQWASSVAGRVPGGTALLAGLAALLLLRGWLRRGAGRPGYTKKRGEDT